jgi:transcriptional regulator with XRE-family HTH domain
MKSERIAEKLLQLRIALGLSQEAIIECMELSENISKSSISAYESGKRDPHRLF